MSWPQRHPGAVALGLFLLFFAIYFAWGVHLFEAIPWRNDELFEIDAARVAEWMTRSEALHLRTRVHPLYVLLVQPIVALSSAFVPSQLYLVQAWTAAFAAGAVALSFLAALRWKRDLWLALGVACLFGGSASQLVLGAVPDTTGLATLVLVAAVTLFLRDAERAEISQALWLAVAVLALGVTTTNVIAPALLYFGLCFLEAKDRGEARARLRYAAGRTALGLACVLLVTAVLAGVQQALYTNTKLFFRPELIAHEVSKFASLAVLEQPMVVVSEVVKHFLLAGVVAPLPYELWIRDQPAVTFVGSYAFSGPGGAAALLWVGTTMLALLRLRQAPERERVLYVACAAAVFAQLVMHCFYGVAERGKMEFFLYTGNATWLVIVLVTSGLRSGSAWARVTVAALAAFTAWSSFAMLERVAWILGRAT